MAEWLFALGIVLFYGWAMFSAGSWYGARSIEPEPCRRKHRDEL